MQKPGAVPHRQLFVGIAAAAAGFLALAVVAIGGAILWLTQADLKPLVERQATEALGRKVSLGGFDIAWGDPLGLEVRDLSVANAPWGSDPEMIRLGRLSALVDVPSLLKGVLRYEKLRVADLKVVLERDKNGTGNWKYAGSSGGLGLVPKTRTQFPTLIDFAGENGLITYRTRGGNILSIKLDQVAIASPDEYSPIALQATGAYNSGTDQDIAIKLDATTEPYFILRDNSTPFGTRFTLLGKDTDIAFDGTMMEPLDFEGVRGKFSLAAKTLNDLMAAAGAPQKVALPLLLVGDLARYGDYWSLSEVRGRLSRASFTGKLELLEGRPTEKGVAPDDIALALDFGTVDVDPLLAAFGGGKDQAGGEIQLSAIALRPKGLDAVNLAAILSSEQVSVAGLRLPSFALDGRLEDGEVTLRDLKFVFGGGTLAFDGSLKGQGDSGDLALNAHLIKAQAQQVARLLGGGDQIRGRLNGAAMLRLQGVTLGEALKTGSGAALVTLAAGDIARSLVEQISVDLRSLFRTEQGRVQVGCLLAAMTVKNGVGTLSPLRLESDAAVVLGGGRVDLVGRRLDLTLKTARDSTSFFALDTPIEISGPFDKLSVAPNADADQSLIKASEQGVTPASLPQGLRAMAQQNACVQ
jgi:AsmA family protein